MSLITPSKCIAQKVADVSRMQAPAIIRERVAFTNKPQYFGQFIVTMIGSGEIGIDVGHWVSFFISRRYYMVARDATAKNGFHHWDRNIVIYDILSA